MKCKNIECQNETIGKRDKIREEIINNKSIIRDNKLNDILGKDDNDND